MNHKLTFVLEMIWLLVTVIALGLLLYNILTHGVQSSMGLLGIGLISLFMYLHRRNSRKNK